MLGIRLNLELFFFDKDGEGLFLQFADDFHYQIEVTLGNGKYNVGQIIWIREWEIVDN
jgi:hypothetical protein